MRRPCGCFLWHCICTFLAFKNRACVRGQNSIFYVMTNVWQSDVAIPQVVSELRTECAGARTAKGASAPARPSPGACSATWSLRCLVAYPVRPQSDMYLKVLPVSCLLMQDSLVGAIACLLWLLPLTMHVSCRDSCTEVMRACLKAVRQR